MISTTTNLQAGSLDEAAPPVASGVTQAAMGGISRPAALHDAETRKAKRHLFGWSLLLFLIGMGVGATEFWYTNSRLGNIAHAGCVTNAAFLGVLGAAWSNVRLSPRASKTARWLLVFSTYLGCTTLLLASLWGTKIFTPFGAGPGGKPWQELVVGIGLFSFAPMQIAGLVITLAGLWRASREDESVFLS